MFRSRYAMTLSGERVDTTITAVLFSIHFELLADVLGPQAAIEVLKALGEHVNEHFGPMGGFSSRHRRGEILTILPRVGLDEAGQLVHDFAQRLQQKALPGIQALTRVKTGAEECFEIYVTAGMTEGSTSDDIDQILEKAKANQKIIARYQCGKEGASK
jgi:phospholipid/cholesterol/gamma-HCH transport system ATP-binding protein